MATTKGNVMTVPENSSRGDESTAAPRRWTLFHDDSDYWFVDAGYEEFGRPKVEVMAVSEHEAALTAAEEFANSSEHPNWEAGWYAGHARGRREGLAAARQVDEALTDRLWCAIDDQLPIGEAPPSMDILRAALLAALTPEPEEKR